MTRQNRHPREPDPAWTSNHSLHSVAESALAASMLRAGSNDGLPWVSTDRGGSWRKVTQNLPGEERPRQAAAPSHPHGRVPLVPLAPLPLPL